MKILEEGKLPGPWSVEITCCKCKSRLLVEESDLQKEESPDDGPYRPPAFFYVSWRCSFCGTYDSAFPPHYAALGLTQEIVNRTRRSNS